MKSVKAFPLLFPTEGTGFSDLAEVDNSCLAPLLLSCKTERSGYCTLVLLPTEESARRTADECAALAALDGRNIRILHLPENGRGRQIFTGAETGRARALHRALNEKNDLIIGSVHAFTGPAPVPEVSRRSSVTLRPGMKISPEQLLKNLTELDYDSESQVAIPGEFSRRGGIMDIFSPAADFPCRVEFFGDEIESLRRFSVETQRSDPGEVTDYPVITRDGSADGGRNTCDFFNYMNGREWEICEIYPDSGRERLRHYGADDAVKRLDNVSTELAESGRHFVWLDSVAAINNPDMKRPDYLPSPLSEHGEKSAALSETGFSAGRLAELRKITAQRLKSFIAEPENWRLIVTARERPDAAEIKEWITEAGIRTGQCEFRASGLSHGFISRKYRIALITGSELTGCGVLPADDGAAEWPDPSVQQDNPAPEDFNISDFDINDFVVHLDYGIGIFKGVKTLKSDRIAREMLAIEYAAGQTVYIRMCDAAKISKYYGGRGKVRIHRIGSGKWKRDKENASAGIRSYAAEMLRFQAVRESNPGIAFPKENRRECMRFIRSFPFKDTPDQQRSTQEIYSDMESNRPMDRLLCGDVGYGKTEVALRAIFKAAVSGYQSAVLAPTTVLAQQHYNTLLQRMADYPFTIEMLSRFTPPAEQKRIIDGLKSGGVDIVVGTHRLCGKGIKFANLGLVVIDEEQRFGVNHKERLRRMRTEVEVLSMSATPIPRTLYMAMAGARDLSTLNTAPAERLPVNTVISPPDRKMIEDAVRAELARGGQVYYLYNRVRTIESRAEKLRRMFPDARIAVAHGQMPESALEETMTDFVRGKIDCLVCTTIIESGLDVPNANTIIIENASSFGLSELYQLRGRVGRWKNLAYAYLLTPENQAPSRDGRKRLNAIRRCSGLGAGFQLALHDLEIRGAGNILGAEQSGHIETIGLDMYCMLLKKEVENLNSGYNKKIFFQETKLSIDFVEYAFYAPEEKLCAGIPREYADDDHIRISLYRKLGKADSEAAVDDFAAELRDRFGALPQPVVNLLNVVRLKILASSAGFITADVTEGKVMLRDAKGDFFRINGRMPQINYANPPELRMMHLLRIFRSLNRN